MEDLLRVFAELDDVDTIYHLLEDMCTIREIRETSQRLAVARLLSSGKSYLAIEEATGASATTIARVSKCLSYGAGGYAAALAVLNADEGADQDADQAAGQASDAAESADREAD